MIRASIVGGSGYVGGELLRLLLDHPETEVGQVTSERNAGSYVHFTHPNLRGRTQLRFSTLEELDSSDVLFLALPHGSAMRRIEEFARRAPRLIDLSADFRLPDAAAYERWYGEPHAALDWLGRFVYGLPELYRDEIANASFASGVGCNATATLLAIWPPLRAGLVEEERGCVCEVKVGSSEGGQDASAASHHPERSGAMRSFAPTGHRHTGEVEQALQRADIATRVHLSVTAVESVRGVLATAHLFLRPEVDERDLWRAYREAYSEEPFIRLVKEKTGVFRYPEPKILAGTNYADVGFDFHPETHRAVSLCALDNLMKGAAGSAVQSMNLMLGFEETAGLKFPGLHPI